MAGVSVPDGIRREGMRMLELVAWRRFCALGIAGASLFTAAGAAEPQPAWTLKDALKQIDRAVKDLRGLTADVRWEEQIESQKVEGQGKVWIRLDGRFRGEVEGSNPRTIVVVPGMVHVYRPLDGTAEAASTAENPGRLVQYALLGFTPAGSALKKGYEVSLIREDELDGQRVLLFTLVPKSEAIRASLPNIMLWVDTTTWLPAGQLFRDGGGVLRITTRYTHVTPQSDLPDERFEPAWPEGTQIIGN